MNALHGKLLEVWSLDPCPLHTIGLESISISLPLSVSVAMTTTLTRNHPQPEEFSRCTPQPCS